MRQRRANRKRAAQTDDQAQSQYPDQQSYRDQGPYRGEQSYRDRRQYPDQRSYPDRSQYPDQQAYQAPPRYADQQPPYAEPSYAEPSYADQPPHWVPQPPEAAAPARPKRRRSRTVAVLVMVAVLIIGLGVAGASYLLLRTKGSAQQTAASYLRAWQQGDYPAMERVSVNVPGSGLAGPLTQTSAELGVRSTHLKLGRVTTSGGTAQARFTVTDDLASSHVWTYQGLLRLVDRNRRWWVNWSPAAIYPALRPGERFALSSAWPARAQVLAADGSVLSSPAAISQSGSLALLTGILVPATAKQAKALGAPYKAGDPIGLGGIEQAYQAQLAGRPSLTVRIVGPGKHVDGVAAHFAAAPGKPVRTSIELAVQLAASHAVSSANTTKAIDMVVVQPSTGRVLAVVERPGGFDRALEGIFPPGSTFKVVTASALARTGLTPSSPVQCPSQVTIDGRTFHNDANEHLGATSLQTAFAVSCNSTFALLATQRLTGTSLGSMASSYGFNASPALGIPATLGRFTRPHSPVDLAADAFGQGLDLVNPLSQATVAAAVDNGSWRPPLLVISPAPRQTARPHALSAAILATLRPMMRAVVTSGTASGVGFGPGVYGKTGTAEYGTGPHPQSHGWFIGYRGDIAFAVLVEDGGFGANSAGPIANAFLRGY
ncbi:MAG TPA: penicillin-binding transpeptidase domain-containing protein [Streptosporangiaceae bacterium]|nr:penicillin-binding transpeptidase domain-containing protein [Streptosporangiaceae bacterium]